MEPPVFLEPEVVAALQELEGRPDRRELFWRLDEAIRLLEEDHTSRRARRRSFTVRPTTWGIPVHGSGEDWFVLWSLATSDSGEPIIIVRWLGPAFA